MNPAKCFRFKGLGFRGLRVQQAFEVLVSASVSGEDLSLRFAVAPNAIGLGSLFSPLELSDLYVPSCILTSRLYP